MRSLVGSALVVAAVGVGSYAAATEWPSRYPPPAERGRELYARLCASCHGKGGAGDGPAAAALVAKVPDFSQGFGDRDVDELVRAVLRGKGAMPSFENALKDLKPWSGDTKEFAKAVVDHLGRVGRNPDPPEVAAPIEDDGDDEGDAP